MKCNHEDAKTRKKVFMLRIPSPLPEDLEHLVHKTIGCCVQVHRALGPGLLESPDSRAVAIELTEKGIPCEREKEFVVTYRGQPLCRHRIDFVCLRICKIPVGLLMNINEVLLQDGIKRIIL